MADSDANHIAREAFAREFFALAMGVRDTMVREATAHAALERAQEELARVRDEGLEARDRFFGFVSRSAGFLDPRFVNAGGQSNG